jgi:hypothetical protein
MCRVFRIVLVDLDCSSRRLAKSPESVPPDSARSCSRTACNSSSIGCLFIIEFTAQKFSRSANEQPAKPFPKKNLINSRKLVRVCNVPAVQSQQVLCWSQIPVATADGLRWFEHTIYATMPFEPLDIVSVGTFFDLFQKLDGRGLVAGLAGILFRKNHLNFNGDDVHRSLNESSVLQAFTG